MKKAVIIFGHGSKANEALDTLKKIRDVVKPALDTDMVEVASMQFSEPDLPTCISELVQKGVEKIVIMPFFLYYGIHMQEDIPQILAQERAKYPQVEIVIASNLGADQRLADIVVEKIREVG